MKLLRRMVCIVIFSNCEFRKRSEGGSRVGQYFNWVNFDKRQIIETWIWPNGQGLQECAYVGCEETDAALTMLAEGWAGDLVVFLGDYAIFQNESNPMRKQIEQRLGNVSAEDFMYDLEDITGRFDYAERHPELKHPIDCDDSEGWVSYTGPFDVPIVHYRYVLNESKQEFVDRARTAVRYIDSATGEIVRYDPVPSMMSSQTKGLEHPDCEIEGLWIGDAIRPSHDRPSSVYMEVGGFYSYWASPIVNCSDETIEAIIAKHDLDMSDEELLFRVSDYLPHDSSD